VSIVVWKEIKPKAIKVKAMRKVLLNEMTKSGKDIKKDFEKTTSTWKTNVAFDIVTDLDPKGPQVLVGTDNEIYGFVDKGTKPHSIRPKRARILRFQSGYKAKTSVNKIGASSGGPFGDNVFARSVNHPGTKARNFTSILQKKWQSIFKRRMEKAMRKARTVSGHSI